MIEKEVAEIRRRFRAEKSNITNVIGCYVNEDKEIMTAFNQSLFQLSEDETEKFLSILKRTLSGTLNKNLVDIAFTTQQVIDSEEHQLLMSLRASKLCDETALKAFFQKVAQTVAIEGTYLILLAHDTYDIPYRSKDGGQQGDASSEVFSYILCSVCPVKMTKPALSYYAHTNEFRSRPADWLVSPPELGFMFPAFDDRSTNIYNALYYTRDIADNHKEFADVIFNSEVPMPAAEQKRTFQAILGETLEDECEYGVVQAVHGQLQEMLDQHKENKEEEPLTVSKGTVTQILKAQGVSEPHVAAFAEQFDAQFGLETDLSVKNIVDSKQIEMTSGDIKIQVNSERDDLVETRIIDGTKYIMIRVEDGVEVNGIPVHIS